jgi:fatty-acyl-CoA synthase
MDLSVWLKDHAEATPDRPAIRFEGRVLSYGDAYDRARQLAGILQTRFRIRRGDRVAHLGYNSPDFILLVFACARLGAILVPLNWRLAPREHAYILGDADASLLLYEDGFQPVADELATFVPNCRQVTLDRSSHGKPFLDEGKLPADGLDAATSLDLPVLIVYTSGTTGHPKGAMLSQNALLWNARNAIAMQEITAQDHVLTTLPMFHVGGLNIQTMPVLYAGGVVTLHRRFDAGRFFQAVTEDRPSLTVLVPTQIIALQGHPEWLTTDFSSFRLITTGSSVVPAGLIEAVHARGVPITQVYGSTETAPYAAGLAIAETRSHAGSVGKAAPHCLVRVVDNDGVDCAPGRRGEILVKGPNVMSGYWRNSQETEAALQHGWFHTGDIGHFDEDGRLYVDDRKKDLIISGGENIYPAELEAILLEDERIAEAAVIAWPDEQWGEVALAVVVRKPEAVLDEAETLAIFDGKLARFKHPKRVVFIAALPRNAMGKSQKFRLRDMLTEPVS